MYVLIAERGHQNGYLSTLVLLFVLNVLVSIEVLVLVSAYFHLNLSYNHTHTNSCLTLADITKIRSLTMDKWEPTLVSFLCSVGNLKANKIWEAQQFKEKIAEVITFVLVY